MTFGYKTAWFAIRTSDTEAVARALGLKQLRSTPAEAGIAAGYREPGQVFITPAIDGWTLAMSTGFFDLADGRPPRFLDTLTRVSAALGAQAQFFLSYRVVDTHVWARARNGQLERAYGHSQGDDIANLGDMTADEIALGHRFFDPACPEAQDDAYWQRDDLRLPGEEDVMKVAARWSLNPSIREDMPDGWLADRATTPAARTPAPAGSKPWWRLW